MFNETVFNLMPALILAVAAGMVGVFALFRRMSLAADAMSHVALPGLGLAFLYGINPLLGGAVTLFLGAVIIWGLERKIQIPTETIIGVIFSISLALGSLLTPEEDLIDALFGGFGQFSVQDFILTSVFSFFIIGIIIFLKQRFVIEMISKDLAQVTNLRSDRLDLVFLLLFVLTIILGLKFLGTLLMGSLIIIPAAASKNFGWNINSMLFFASVAAVISVSAGFGLANVFGGALGPFIVSVAGGIFFLSLFVKKG